MSTRRRIERACMAALGALALTAGVVAAPGNGSALNPSLEDLTSTSLTLPPELQHLVDTLGGVVSSTTTTASTTTTLPPTSTSTTLPVGTTTSTTLPGTVTTTTVPDVVEEVEKALKPVTDALDDVVAPEAAPAEPIEVESLIEDYRRVAFPSYQPVWGRRSTSEVIGILAGSGASREQIAQVLAPFPIAGPANYSDDWGAPRFTPSFHAHEGCDIFAERGTPVIAGTAGTITRISLGTAVGGNSLHLTTEDGTYYYYAHLDRVSPLLAVGSRVVPGQVIATVGSTGNAEGGAPHLHFEIHPGGGGPVPPAPYLDAWLAAALEEARAMAADPAAAPPPLRVPVPSAAAPAELAAFGGQAPELGGDLPTGLLLIVPGLLFLVARRNRAQAVLAALEASVAAELAEPTEHAANSSATRGRFVRKRG
jgi:murein DD-endopeptidase MepM/ murein hydrolase activator NlpD